MENGVKPATLIYWQFYQTCFSCCWVLSSKLEKLLIWKLNLLCIQNFVIVVGLEHICTKCLQRISQKHAHKSDYSVSRSWTWGNNFLQYWNVCAGQTTDNDFPCPIDHFTPSDTYGENDQVGYPFNIFSVSLICIWLCPLLCNQRDLAELRSLRPIIGSERQRDRQNGHIGFSSGLQHKVLAIWGIF